MIERGAKDNDNKTFRQISFDDYSAKSSRARRATRSA